MNKVSLAQVRTAFLRIAIGLLLIGAGIAKLMSPLAFLAALKAADWLPNTLLSLLLIGVPVVEVALGFVLLIGWKVRTTAIGSFILIALFTVFLLIETARGNNTNCGCFGESNGLMVLLTTGSGALIRNGLLLLMSVSLARGATSSDRWTIDRILCPYE
ncbi:MAG: hypothetical protein DMF60_06045 [Acidobacteria bacterium]|nr:MAG: hypothetical protein DMF60_06045 [Acidobacteriota bacterium]